MVIHDRISTARLLVDVAEARGDDHSISVRIVEHGPQGSFTRPGRGELRFPVRFRN